MFIPQVQPGGGAYLELIVRENLSLKVLIVAVLIKKRVINHLSLQHSLPFPSCQNNCRKIAEGFFPEGLENVALETEKPDAISLKV